MNEMAHRPRFLIVSLPQDWGGPVILHLLCRMLADLGYDARVFRLRADERIPPFRQEFLKSYLPFMSKKPRQILDSQEGSVKGCVLTDWPYVDDDTIVVYPEIVFGNPLAARHVVRWFLNENLYTCGFAGMQPYGKDDLFICYADIFNDYKLNPSCRKITLYHFNHDVYKRWNYGHREGSCFLIRKGSNRADLPSKLPGIVIDALTEEEKVEVLNKCEYFYTYDTHTSYATVAAVCGCVSVIIPEPGKSWKDYAGGEAKALGVAYGTSPEELEFARSTYKDMMAEIESYDTKNQENVQKFLAYCREHFKVRMDSRLSW